MEWDLYRASDSGSCLAWAEQTWRIGTGGADVADEVRTKRTSGRALTRRSGRRADKAHEVRTSGRGSDWAVGASRLRLAGRAVRRTDGLGGRGRNRRS